MSTLGKETAYSIRSRRLDNNSEHLTLGLENTRYATLFESNDLILAIQPDFVIFLARTNNHADILRLDRGEEATQSLLEEMIAGFEAEHPNVNIEYIGYPWADQYNQLVLAVAGGNAPDIAQIDINFPGLFELGAFEPLTPYFSEDEINDLIPAARDGGTFRGELVAWPWRTGTIQLIYNPVLLEQAGLPARAPEALDELDGCG